MLAKIERQLSSARESRQVAFGRGLGRALGLEASAEASLQELAGEQACNRLLEAWNLSFEAKPSGLRVWQAFAKYQEAKTQNARAELQAWKARRHELAERHEWNRIMRDDRF